MSAEKPAHEAKGEDGDLPPPTVLLPAEVITKHKKDYISRMERLTQPANYTPDDGEFGVRGWARGKEGGLTCVDFAQLESQKGVMTHLVKSFGANLVQGKSVVNVSLPVRIFEPRSFLQRIPDAWCYAPVFLTRAAFAPTPLERMKLVMTWMVAGLHKAVTNTKPFNPILGETFQGSYSDGAQLYLEQTSHHPPISSFELIGPNGIYHVHGSHEFAASLRPNSIQGQQIGQTHVTFPDGSCVSFNLPYALVRGTILGDRNFNWQGTCHFVDEKNHLRCDLVFNPDEKNSFSKLFSSQKTPDDHVRGDIFYDGPLPLHRVEPLLADHAKGKKGKHKGGNSNSDVHAHGDHTTGGRQLVCHVSGSWMDGLAFGPPGHPLVPLWTKASIAPFKTILHESPLPSDARYREDLVHLIAGDQDEAQRWKSLLEERQRDERNLRKANEKLVKKRLETLQRRTSGASLLQSSSSSQLHPSGHPPEAAQ